MAIINRIVCELKDAAVLGPGFPLRAVSGFLGRKYHKTTIKGIGTVYIRPGTSDAHTFVEIMRHKAYDLLSLRQFPSIMKAYRRMIDANQNPIIIDAGANVGAASLWFSRQFSEAFVYAFEPDPDNAAVCRLNTSSFPKIEPLEAAIGSRPGRVSLSNPEKKTCSIQTSRSENGEVIVRTIPEILTAAPQPAKLFLVKIDIEGFEDDMFADNIDWLNDAQVIMIELHDWLFPGRGTSRNFQRAIGAQNFEVIMSGQYLFYIRLPD